MGRKAERVEFQIAEVVCREDAPRERQDAAYLAMAAAAIRVAEKRHCSLSPATAQKKSLLPIERT